MLQRKFALVILLALTPWFTPQLAAAKHSPPLLWELKTAEIQPEPPILNDRGVVQVEQNAVVADAVSGEIAYQNWEKEKQAKPVVNKKSVASSTVVLPRSTKGNTFAAGQCTDYVARKIVIPWRGNAINWLRNSQSYGAVVDKVPIVGAILVTNESRAGHVAYIESVSGNTFTISEWNYAGKYKTTTRTFTVGDSRIKGIIHYN